MSSSGGGCSIHLGNYIIVIQPPTGAAAQQLQNAGLTDSMIIPGVTNANDKKGKPPLRKGTKIDTSEANAQGMSSLNYELAWMRFLKTTEDEYLMRLSRHDKQQPLSIFEVSNDLFESYLLKISGRALASVQHHNLNLTTAMNSHLKIFENQDCEMPPEEELIAEQEAQIVKKRAKRELRRQQKKRRETAEFGQSKATSSSTIENPKHRVTFDLPEEPALPTKNKKKPMIDSLNERDDDDDEDCDGEREGVGSDKKLVDEDDELDRDDMGVTSESMQRQQMASTLESQQERLHMVEEEDPRGYMEIQDQAAGDITFKQDNMSQQFTQENLGLDGSRASAAFQPDIEHEDGEDLLGDSKELQHIQQLRESTKIKIGDLSIDDPIGSVEEDQQNNNQQDFPRDELNEITANPFQEPQMSSPKQSEHQSEFRREQSPSFQRHAPEGQDDGVHHEEEQEIENHQNVDDKRSTFEIKVNEFSNAEVEVEKIEPHPDQVEAVQSPTQEEVVEEQKEEKQAEERPFSPPEQEIVMRFEVAVGTTPVNLTFEDDQEKVEEKRKSPEKAEIAIGTTPQDQSLVDSPIKQNPKADVADIAIGTSYIMSEPSERNQPPVAQNQSPQAQPQKNTKLEVTLTAEADKPIVVEVRGGEKQYLISALTKHIYDILSQPHRLQTSEITIQQQDEGQGDRAQIGGGIKINNKNINLKLKSLKKTLMRDNLQQLVHKRESARRNKEGIFDTQTRNEMYSGLTIGNSNNAITIDDMNASSVFKAGAAEVEVRDQEEEFLKVNTKHWKSKGNTSRSGSQMVALSPLTTSVLDDQRDPLANPTERNTKNFQDTSKRSTIQAYQESNIHLEQQFHHTNSFDMESNATAELKNQGLVLNESKAKQYASHQISIEQSQQSNEQIMSRPETAGFGGPGGASRADISKTSEAVNQDPILDQAQSQEQTITMPIQEVTPGLDAQKVEKQEHQNRVNTPEVEYRDSISPISTALNSDPLEIGGLHPIHPQSAQQQNVHQRDSFNNVAQDSQGPSRLDSHTFGVVQSVESEPIDAGGLQGEYLTPKLSYYDAFQQMQQHLNQIQNMPQEMKPPAPASKQGKQRVNLQKFATTKENKGQQNYDADVGMASEIGSSYSPDDYILAEGIPLYYYSDGQVMDYKFNTPPSKLHNLFRSNDKREVIRGGKWRNPNQFSESSIRIRKVVLPNYYPAGSSTSDDQSQMPIAEIIYPAGHKSKKGYEKELPVVQTRKRYFQTYQNQNGNTIYSVNGGPVFKNQALNQQQRLVFPGAPQQLQARSLSPLRRRYGGNNQIYYTSNYMTQKQHQQVINSVQQILESQQAAAAAAGQSPINLEELAQIAYNGQMQQYKMRNSPYLSDDEYKILHDFYDIQCEPTGLQRGGVPLMKVKRVKRPKNRQFNIFTFTEEPAANLSLPKALSSLQIYYPQCQPSMFTQEMLSKTLSTPSKWFERFNQSTKNLNLTLQNMHSQHIRKLRSYSVSSTPSAAAGIATNLSRQNSYQQFGGQLNHQSSSTNLKKSLQQHKNFQGKPQRTLAAAGQRQILDSAKNVTTAGEVSTSYMPPLHKIYTQTMNQEGAGCYLGTRTKGKKTKQLPPRPKIATGSAKGLSQSMTTNSPPKP